MKSTGVIRRIDDLGRIVIPKEIRKNLRIKEGDNLDEIMKVNYDKEILKMEQENFRNYIDKAFNK